MYCRCIHSVSLVYLVLTATPQCKLEDNLFYATMNGPFSHIIAGHISQKNKTFQSSFTDYNAEPQQ